MAGFKLIIIHHFKYHFIPITGWVR